LFRTVHVRGLVVICSTYVVKVPHVWGSDGPQPGADAAGSACHLRL